MNSYDVKDKVQEIPNEQLVRVIQKGLKSEVSRTLRRRFELTRAVEQHRYDMEAVGKLIAVVGPEHDTRIDRWHQINQNPFPPPAAPAVPAYPAPAAKVKAAGPAQAVEGDTVENLLARLAGFLNKHDDQSRRLWNILTILRGPDDENTALKAGTTAVIRKKIGIDYGSNGCVVAEDSQEGLKTRQDARGSHHFFHHAKRAFESLGLAWSEVNK